MAHEALELWALEVRGLGGSVSVRFRKSENAEGWVEESSVWFEVVHLR